MIEGHDRGPVVDRGPDRVADRGPDRGGGWNGGLIEGHDRGV